MKTEGKVHDISIRWEHMTEETKLAFFDFLGTHMIEFSIEEFDAE